MVVPAPTHRVGKNKHRHSEKRMHHAEYDEVEAARKEASKKKREEKKAADKKAKMERKWQKRNAQAQGDGQQHEPGNGNAPVIALSDDEDEDDEDEEDQERLEDHEQQEQHMPPAPETISDNQMPATINPADIMRPASQRPVFTALSTEEQQYRMPERFGSVVAPVQMTMSSDYEKELAEHRAWVDKMTAPPPEAAEEQMPGEYFQPPADDTVNHSFFDEAMEALGYDDDAEMDF